MLRIESSGFRSQGYGFEGKEAADEAAAADVREQVARAGPGGSSTSASAGVTEAKPSTSTVGTGKLMDHGGGVLQQVDVAPVYLGRYWNGAAGKADRSHNDAAMADLVKNRGMTGLWKEYGAGTGTTSASRVLAEKNPTRLTQDALEALVTQQVKAGKFDTSNPERVFMLVLPPGCELVGSDGSSSQAGLGGYHGSVNVGGKEVYYAAIAYSERSGNRMNGIDFTGNPQDNLSIVESHEITEAVTDPNVEVSQREDDFFKLGWYDDVTRWQAPGSPQLNVGKGEIGDIPILNAELDGDSALKSVWGRSDGFAYQKEWSNRDGQAELAPKES